MTKSLLIIALDVVIMMMINNFDYYKVFLGSGVSHILGPVSEVKPVSEREVTYTQSQLPW